MGLLQNRGHILQDYWQKNRDCGLTGECAESGGRFDTGVADCMLDAGGGCIGKMIERITGVRSLRKQILVNHFISVIYKDIMV